MDGADYLPEMLTINDVATMAKCSTKTVRRWIASGAVQGVKTGGTVRVLRADFIETIERGRIFVPSRREDRI